jgi:hypothetical protein
LIARPAGGLPLRIGFAPAAPGRRPLGRVLLLAAALVPGWGGTLCAQVPGAAKPPVHARVERARVFLSPFTPVEMRLDLGDQPDPTADTLEGIGISLGADFIVLRRVSLWVTGHAGALTGVERQAGGATTRLRRVEGSFRVLEAGASGVLAQGALTGLLGIGLFAAAADWEGFDNAFGVDVKTDATLIGALATLRADYTLRNGFFLGAGMDLGGGIAGGREARGARSPVGEWRAIYVPLGWSY